MNRFRLSMDSRRERGAVALIVSMCMVVLLAASALGMDIAKLAYERQALRAAVDAGAQAGSYALGEPARAAALGKTTSQLAIADARSYADKSAPDLGLTNLTKNVWDVNVFCTVGLKKGTLSTPDPAQISATCPGAPTNATATGCNATLCAVPCPVTARCNTIKVSVTRTVDFMFGPAINIPTGTTGAVSSAACRGTCGGFSPNPMNVVVMADRTTSMSSDEIDKMQTGIENMLTVMTPSLQYVAFGAIHKSATTSTTSSTSTCLMGSPTSGNAFSQAESSWGSTWNASQNTGYASGNLNFTGRWVPQEFSKNYQSTDAAGNAVVNASSSIFHQIDCMSASSGTPVGADNGVGTHLASAMKGAARYLLGYDPNNIAALDASHARDEYGTPRKVIVLETDGRPDEVFNSNSGALTLNSNSYDIGARHDGDKGCDNFLAMANAAKAAGITVITIGYGDANGTTCARKYQTNDPVGDNTGTKLTRSYLAAASGEANSTDVATATDCSTSTGLASENSDGDDYFCAASAADLSGIFASAMGAISGNTRLISIPNVSN